MPGLSPTILGTIAAASLAVLSRSDRGEGHGGGDPENTYGLPRGEDLAAELRRWFLRQQREVLEGLPKDPAAAVPDDLSVTDWTTPMSAACVPILAVEWDKAGKDATERLGLEPERFEVTSPHLKGAIEKASLDFCAATNATTTKTLARTTAELRAQLVAGLVDRGETPKLLADRVAEVFKLARRYRAERIAVTESCRAYHAAEEAAAVDSGVVAGFELLLSGDACPLCRKVATEAKRVRLGEPFAVIGENPNYSQIKYPPLHPMCQCTVVPVLLPQYGGPADPGFRPTLVQPAADDDYRAPEGLPEASPEPGRARPVFQTTDHER